MNKSNTNSNEIEDEANYDTLKDDYQQIIEKTLKFLLNFKGSKQKSGSKSRPNSLLSPGSKIPDSVCKDLLNLLNLTNPLPILTFNTSDL